MRPSHLFAGLTVCAAAILAAACDNAVAPRPNVDAAAPRFSNGLKLGQCFLQVGDVSAPQIPPGAAGNAVITAPAGQVVTRVAVKAGPPCWFTPEGATGTSTIEIGGAPCYVVAGLGTQTVTVTRVGSGPTCKDISHVESVSGVPAPSTGLLQLCVTVIGDNPPPSTLVTPIAFFAAGQEVDVAHGHCAAAIELPAGQVAITQGPTLFVFLSNAVSVPDGRVLGVDFQSQSATVTVVAGETTVVTLIDLWLPDPEDD